MRTMTITQGGAAAAEVQAREAARQAQVAEQQARIAQEQAAQAQARAATDAERLSQQISEDVARDVERALEAGNVSISQQGGRRVIELPNGQKIIINGSNIRLDGVPVADVNRADDIPALALQTGQRITLFVCMAIAFIVVGLPIARAFARWLDRRGSVTPGASDTAQRLAAIENAVESVAIEVERISEGQRFTARLLSERARDEVPVGANRVG